MLVEHNPENARYLADPLDMSGRKRRSQQNTLDGFLGPKCICEPDSSSESQGTLTVKDNCLSTHEVGCASDGTSCELATCVLRHADCNFC